jgi:hypothetical protein
MLAVASERCMCVFIRRDSRFTHDIPLARADWKPEDRSSVIDAAR